MYHLRVYWCQKRSSKLILLMVVVVYKTRFLLLSLMICLIEIFISFAETMMPKSLWSLLVLFLMLLDYTEGWRRRRRRRCPVRNCAVSAWTKYSPCSQPCGNGGTKKRTRTVTRPGTCGGGCPYALVDIQPCDRGCPNGGTPVTGRCICKSGYSGRCCTGG